MPARWIICLEPSDCRRLLHLKCMPLKASLMVLRVVTYCNSSVHMQMRISDLQGFRNLAAQTTGLLIQDQQQP